LAGPIKGIEIAISADTSGVTKGLKEVTDASMKTSKNLKTVESLLKLDPHSTELVAEKQKLLAQSVEQTKEKLSKLKAAQDDVKKAFERGEISEEQYIAFQGEIVKTENRLKSLEGQTNETGAAMQDAGEKASGFGDKLKNGLGAAAKAAGVAVAAVGTAVVAGAKALTDFSVAGASYADTIITDSTVTGIATDKLQEYRYAAELIDVSTETLTKSMGKNIKSMTAAAKGSGAAADSYKKLGISVTNSDGSLRDSQEVYWESIDALGKGDNETERDALAMQLLGNSAKELNPLIEAGSARMEELGQQARDAGAVLSDEALNSFGAFDDQLQYLKVNSEAAKNALGTALLPMLTDLAATGNGLLTEFTKSIADADGDVGKMADAIGKMIPKIVNAVTKALPQILSLAATIVSSLASALIEQLPMIIQTGMQLIEDLALGIAEALPTLIPTIIDVVLQIVDTLLDNIDMLIDAAIELIEGLAVGIMDALPILIAKAPMIIQKLIDALVNNLPKLIALGLRMIPEIVKGIIQAIPQLLSSAGQIITSLVEGIKTYFSRLYSIGAELVGKIKDGIKSIASKAFEWGADLINGLIDGIKSKITAIKDAVSGVADKIKSFLHFSVPDEGPLADYQTWMPDFMKGLASGIERNKNIVTDAVRGLANDMVLSPTANVSAVGAGAGGGLSQVININLSANIASDLDIRHVAEKIGQELQTITAQNSAMQGAW
jgi:phage-related minor tail protein